MTAQKSYLNAMIKTAMEGGRISLRMMSHRGSGLGHAALKPDNSVVTAADLALSRLLRKNISRFLREPGHILIDEEDKNSRAYFDPGILNRTPYIWVADPIDGTRNFANRMPMYGVSIALLKARKPWLGVVYFPALDELFYCDGERSFFIQNAGSPRPRKTRIIRVDQRITHRSVFFGSDKFFKMFEWDFGLCQIMLPSCAVLDLCWPAIGRGAGAFFNAHLWDFAGAWPIFRSAGLDLRSLKTGKALDRVDVDLFQGPGDRTWRLKDFYILSSKRNFPEIQKAISARR